MGSGTRDWMRRRAMAARPGLGTDHNPLRRRSDRAQGLSGLIAVLLVLAVLPIAVIVSRQTWQHYSAVSEAELRSRHLVSATVAAGDPATRLARGHLAELTWTYPDRVEHRGHIAVTHATEPGDLVPVWVDEAGALTSAPTTRLNVWLDTLGIGLALISGAGLFAVLWYRVSRFLIDRRRTRDLDAEWKRFNESRSQGFRDTRG